MFFNTMYYVVDNFYAGMLSSTALAGISLAAPIYFMGLAVAIGVGQGTNALVGNALGEGKQKKKPKRLQVMPYLSLGLQPFQLGY